MSTLSYCQQLFVLEYLADPSRSATHVPIRAGYHRRPSAGCVSRKTGTVAHIGALRHSCRKEEVLRFGASMMRASLSVFGHVMLSLSQLNLAEE